MEYIVSHYALNVRRPCRLIKQTRSVRYYRSVKDPRHELRSRMHEIARARVRYVWSLTSADMQVRGRILDQRPAESATHRGRS